MIEVNIKFDNFEAHGFYQDDTKLGKIRDAIISQMNNGHVVVLGEDRGILLNPKVIKSVQLDGRRREAATSQARFTTSSERSGGLFLGNGRRWYDVYGSDGMHLC